MKKKDQEAISKLYTEGFDNYTGGHNNPEMDGGAYEDDYAENRGEIEHNKYSGRITKFTERLERVLQKSIEALHNQDYQEVNRLSGFIKVYSESILKMQT